MFARYFFERVLVYLVAAQFLGAVGPGFATAECGRLGICPDNDPQPTTLPRPDTIWYPSPNFHVRDPFLLLDSIAIHTTEGPLTDTLDLFSDPQNTSSAHFVIAPNGDIYQMVSEEDAAHTTTYYNDRSFGIEMVGKSLVQSTWNQDNLSSLVDLLAWLLQAYPNIPLTHPPGDAYDYPGDRFDAAGLVGHFQVQPWNKIDPGPYFPWDKVLLEVEDKLASVPEPTGLVLCGASWALLLGIPRRRMFAKFQ